MKRIFKGIFYAIYCISSIPLIILSASWAIWEWDSDYADDIFSHLFDDILNKLFKS